jgi:type IV pilus assembly protein PilM
MRLRKERRLRLACEFSSTQVVAARADASGAIDLSAVRALRPGALIPSLTGNNLLAAEVVKTVLQEAWSGVGGRRQDAVLVLPDAACRVVLLDFDGLPEKREEADAVVRFRLKKSLPFDVEKARVSWQAQRVADKLNVLAAVVLISVLEEYEGVVRAAGSSPGVVLPSMLASLGLVDAQRPTLAIKVDASTTGIAIVNQGAVLLIRTLDHSSEQPPQAVQLAEDVYSSLVFFQDSYGTRVDKILVGGTVEVGELEAALLEATGLRAEELTAVSPLASFASRQRVSLGAVAGALTN